MKKVIRIVLYGLFFIILIVLLNEKIVEKYFSHKLSNWVEKKISYSKFNFNYPNSISITNLKIVNSNPNYYENIFEAEKVDINFDLKSYLFSELVVINDLLIEKPNFFLELVEKKKNPEQSNEIEDSENNNKEIFYEDNIGIAKKINEDLPDKIWPSKKKDINFLILRTHINDGTAFIKISSIPGSSRILLSNFEFVKVGNHNEYQHYKDVLKIMLFDIFARVKDINKKKILKKIYKF